MTKKRTKPLPRKDFTADLVPSWEGRLFKIRDAAEFGALVDPVLDASPLTDVNYATLFTYMHRRFGPPHRGGDPYKDLSGAWLLSTPEPDVLVRISPSPSPFFSFTPFIVRDQPGHEIELSPADRDRVLSAYGATLLDLLRPVPVRDSDINALGLVEDVDLEHEFQVRPAPSSGYPVPVGLIGENWPDLLEIVRSLAPDEPIAAGLRKAIEVLQAPALARLADAGWPVQRLVLIGAYGERNELAARAGLPEHAVKRLETELAGFADRGTPDMSILDEMPDSLVAEATRILGGLGKAHDADLADWVNTNRTRRAGIELVAELQLALGERDPVIIAPPLPWMTGEQFVEHIRTLGDENLTAWAEGALADPYRRSSFVNIAWNLHHQAHKQAQNEHAPAP